MRTNVDVLILKRLASLTKGEKAFWKENFGSAQAPCVNCEEACALSNNMMTIVGRSARFMLVCEQCEPSLEQWANANQVPITTESLIDNGKPINKKEIN